MANSPNCMLYPKVALKHSVPSCPTIDMVMSLSKQWKWNVALFFQKIKSCMPLRIGLIACT